MVAHFLEMEINDHLVLKGIGTLFGNLIKTQKVSSHQLNFKTNDLVLSLKTI